MPALAWRESRGERGDDLPVVVALHGRGSDAAGAVRDARLRVGPGPDVIAPQAARPCNPFQSGLAAEPSYAGFSWYLGEDAARPEAASFGDALVALDGFVAGLGRACVLVGSGQGAVLARTLATYAPASVVGLLEPVAKLPDIPGWTPSSPAVAPPFVDEGADLARLLGPTPSRARRRAPAFALVVLACALSWSAATPPAAVAASAGPQPASTGAPAVGNEAAEGSCTACHTSFAANPDSLGKLAVDGVPARYEPSRTYPLTVRLSHPDAAALRWGFQMTAIAMKDGAGAGEFVATDAATTQVLPSMTSTRSYIEHGYGGTAIGQAGGAAWSFEWKAPASDVGRVGFFAAGNVANADGSNQGDRVVTPSPSPLAESRGAAD